MILDLRAMILGCKIPFSLTEKVDNNVHEWVERTLRGDILSALQSLYHEDTFWGRISNTRVKQGHPNTTNKHQRTKETTNTQPIQTYSNHNNSSTSSVQ